MRPLSVKKSESVVREGEPLKRLVVAAARLTGLKPGVNKTGALIGAAPYLINTGL